ncbi:hypothetical protein BOTBODRAFT_275889 [Botryobasidium botryosum FD-172 SS1]|uniref:Uncharacterized protein n=1 Tax=Botryobasidium botryosum (strain FD-172 SS1) TaxID=930990 RepID=A0A067MWK5_BOTB1|nr:hypothetical protein BOTBODRAFT_275889 [Botryobasidium botryosum FD-172 SS1]
MSWVRFWPALPPSLATSSPCPVRRVTIVPAVRKAAGIPLMRACAFAVCGWSLDARLAEKDIARLLAEGSQRVSSRIGFATKFLQRAGMDGSQSRVIRFVAHIQDTFVKETHTPSNAARSTTGAAPGSPDRPLMA